jgi:hypothetical protein
LYESAIFGNARAIEIMELQSRFMQSEIKLRSANLMISSLWHQVLERDKVIKNNPPLDSVGN